MNALMLLKYELRVYCVHCSCERSFPSDVVRFLETKKAAYASTKTTCHCGSRTIVMRTAGATEL